MKASTWFSLTYVEYNDVKFNKGTFRIPLFICLERILKWPERIYHCNKVTDISSRENNEEPIAYNLICLIRFAVFFFKS